MHDLIDIGTASGAADGEDRFLAGQKLNALIAAANEGQFGLRNRIRNGDFQISQRGDTFNGTGGGAYTIDGWIASSNGGMTCNITRQLFAAGQTDVPGNPCHYLRWALTGTASGNPILSHRIEDVRTLAGRKVLLSFYAKASSAITVFCQPVQNFGSGGSTAVTVGQYGKALTTSWARHEVIVTLPSISGKTIGTAPFLNLDWFLASGVTDVTVELADVQLEPVDSRASDGVPKATRFERLPTAFQQLWNYRYLQAVTVYTINGALWITILPMRTAPSVSATAGTASNATPQGYTLTHTSAVASAVFAVAEL